MSMRICWDVILVQGSTFAGFTCHVGLQVERCNVEEQHAAAAKLDAMKQVKADREQQVGCMLCTEV